MKTQKNVKFCLTLGLMFAVVFAAIPGVSIATADVCGDGEEYTLWAGQDIDAGIVSVYNDEENLYVGFYPDDPWMLTEVQVYVLDYEPLVRLVPGQAPYKSGNISYSSWYVMIIPLESLDFDFECDVTKLWIQAHASVVILNDEEEIVQKETAFGGDVTKPDRSAWYGNISFTLQCCEECENYEGETAWGGNTEGDGSAWWFYYNAIFGGVQTIWAGQNHNAGTVKVENGWVYITLAPGFKLEDDEEAVKIQGYSEIPSSHPAPGGFSYKGTDLTVNVGVFNYYAIHLDVLRCIDNE